VLAEAGQIPVCLWTVEQQNHQHTKFPYLMLLVLPCPFSAGLLVCRLAAAAVDVRLRNVETSTGPAYTWQVTSSIGSPQNITLYGNQTASTTVNVNVKRTPAGSGYTISGRVVITNTPDSYEVVSIDSVRMLLGPGLPWFGPTPRALDCKQREIMPGDSVSCAFRLHVSNTATSSIRPSVDIKGQRQPVQGESISVTFPAEAAASSSGSSNSNCAVIRDRIVADGAEQGMQLQGAGSAAELLGGGVRVCAESASFSYTAAVGPFRDTEDVCGSYQVGARCCGIADYSASKRMFPGLPGHKNSMLVCKMQQNCQGMMLVGACRLLSAVRTCG
jgi:hypothetical protein